MQAFPHFRREDRTPFRIFEDVVLRLLEAAKVLGKWHHIFFDNFYTSVPMFDTLATVYNTLCCGTIRKNRNELPKPLMVKSHPSLKERGQALFSKAANMVLSVWKDRRLVHVLSTIHGTIMGTCTRTMKNEAGRFARSEIACPEAVLEYNKYMGGVDLADQLYAYYCFGRKSRKWTKKLFFYCLELMKLNSFIMYNSVQDKKVSLYSFSVTLLQQLFTAAACPAPIPRPALTQTAGQNPDRLTSRCLPGDLGRRAYCRVCYYRRKAGTTEKLSQTRYGCDTCNTHLCLPFCFRVYHSVRNYVDITDEE